MQGYIYFIAFCIPFKKQIEWQSLTNLPSRKCIRCYWILRCFDCVNKDLKILIFNCFLCWFSCRFLSNAQSILNMCSSINSINSTSNSANVVLARICSWNQPVQSNEVSFLFMETATTFALFKLTPDKHPPNTRALYEYDTICVTLQNHRYLIYRWYEQFMNINKTTNYLWMVHNMHITKSNICYFI